jgi:hypothetical protein
MGKWDIDPKGVKGVLTKVETHAGDLGTALGSFATDLENCASAVGTSIVAKALSDFATARAPELKSMSTHINNAMTGTVDAVGDYIRGNLEMAANAQHAAAQGKPPPGGQH